MSRNNKSILAVAVLGALYAAGASAQVNISAPLTGAGASPAVQYAVEITKPAAGVALANVAANDIRFALGYNFSSGEVRYARVECSDNISFSGTGTPTSNQAGVAIGAVNTNAVGNAIFFSITDAGAVATADDLVTVPTGWTLRSNADVTCTYSLYDQPSQSQAGGPTGRIFTISRLFLQSVPSYTFTTTPSDTTADVEAANGAYTAFVANDRSLGNFTLALAAAPPLTAAGAAITLADLFAAATSVRLNGDLNAFSNVTHAADALCGAPNQFDVIDAGNSVARETTGAAALNRFVCLTERGNVAIPESNYTVTFLPVANTGYTLANSAALPVGSIIRNGTSLQAPLVQTPNGYISRIAITNTGSVSRTASWNFRPASGATASEANTNYTGPTTGTLTIPANGSIVVNLVDVLGTAATNFNGTPPRGFFTVNAAAPNNQIQGLYQIVNPANGSISNHVMVRPGSN